MARFEFEPAPACLFVGLAAVVLERPYGQLLSWFVEHEFEVADVAAIYPFRFWCIAVMSDLFLTGKGKSTA